MFILLLIGIARQIGSNLVDISDEFLHNTVELFYIANEGILIVENASTMGLPVPDKVKRILAQIKNKGGDSKWKSAKY